MKKTIICSIPMKKDVDNVAIVSKDSSLPVSGQQYRYPINSFLSQTAESEDEYKVVLLIKDDGKEFWKQNVEYFKQELEAICEKKKIAELEYDEVITSFDEDIGTHKSLISQLVEKIETGSLILADITYGPKDLPILLFVVMHFAEIHLQCNVKNILYGKATFENNKVVNSVLCDMRPLFELYRIDETIPSRNPETAREMLKIFLSE